MSYTVNCNYQVLGLEKNGIESPLIWLIHGAGGNLYHYDTVTPTLVEAGFCVLVQDVRSHGLSQAVGDESDIAAAPFEFSDVIADMDTILKETGHAINLFVGGLSMGGMITLLYAEGHDAEFLKEEHIELKGLILMAAGIPYLETLRPGWEVFKTRQATHEYLEFIKTAITESSLIDAGQKEMRRAMALVPNHSLYECFVAIASKYPEPSNSIKAYKPLLQVPMLLISPDQDTYTKEEMCKVHESNLLHGIDSEIIEMVDSGHMVILDQSLQVGIQVRDFCSKH